MRNDTELNLSIEKAIEIAGSQKAPFGKGLLR